MKGRFFSYLFLLAGVGSMLTSCEKKDNEPDNQFQPGNEMLVRSISVPWEERNILIHGQLLPTLLMW